MDQGNGKGASMMAPLRDFIVVRDAKRATPGGIVLPDTGQAPFAEVIAAGPGHTENGILVPNPLAVGDLVLVPSGVPCNQIPWDGETLTIMRARDILAVLPADAADHVFGGGKRVIVPALSPP